MPTSRSQRREAAPERERSVVRHYAGNVGQDPVVRDGSNGEFVTFSLAVTRLYPQGDLESETRWIGVNVNRRDLQDFVLDNIFQGSKVVVEGFPYERESGGNTYYNINATRIGLVDWAQRNGGSTERRERQGSRGEPDLGDGDDDW